MGMFAMAIEVDEVELSGPISYQGIASLGDHRKWLE